MSLPKGFKRLEYIQSSGTQYVDTQFKPNQDTGLVIDCDFLKTNTGNDHHIASVNNSSQYYALRSKADLTSFQIRYNTDALAALSAESLYGRHTFKRDKNKASIDGGAETVSTYGSFQITNTLPIFCYKGASGATSGFSSLKLNSCQIYDNGTLARDFIPCQNADGEIGLWDDVNEVFYGNAGTGTFTAGPVVPETVDESEITELEYIQSSGTQYFKTGFLPTSKSRVIIDFEALVSGVDAGLCGARTTNALKAFCFWFYTNYITSARFDYSGVNPITTAVPSSNKRITLDMNQNTCVCDNFSETQSVATFQCDYDLALFGVNTAGTVGSLFTGRMYSGQAYDNGLLERDFIPAMLSNGEVGLYDRVFHEFYRNAGTGEFIAGPEMVHEDYTELEYIESDGTQYVDTLFTPNNNSRLVLEFEVLTANASGWRSVFGSRQSTTANCFALFIAGTDSPDYINQFYSNVGNTTHWFSLGMDPLKKYLADVNKNVVSINGEVYTHTDVTFQSTQSIYLFANNEAGTANMQCGEKIYFCQIYDDGTEVRIYIPMLHPSGVAGLWDSVNERFYASATTTDFLAGPEAATVPKAPANFRVESATDTLVTLAWDAAEEVLGYRLYRQGQLLADTTEPFVSVTVEPFAGAVFILTAYNENGEGAGTSLTHYSIPANPLLYLITDRTQADVTEGNSKGYYAASDLNRVGYAMDYLATIIRGYGYTLEVHTKTDWTDEDWKLTGEMVKYLQSLNNLKGVFSTLIELPKTMEKIDYVDANNIELLLLTIDETITRVVAGFIRANAFSLYSGQRSLPVSQSDRGRNWGQLDAMETTWANWQLATWYLLLYGNLKAEGVVE